VGQHTSSLPTHLHHMEYDVFLLLGSAFLPPCAPCTPKGTRRAAAVSCIQRSASGVLCVFRYVVTISDFSAGVRHATVTQRSQALSGVVNEVRSTGVFAQNT
jgi:hypothetical protein